MLAIFCLRLASGLIASLLLLSPAQVNPRFFRTHFLTTFGLTAVATTFLAIAHRLDLAAKAAGDQLLWLSLATVMVLTVLGSISWMLDGAPLGRLLMHLTLPTLLTALVVAGNQTR